RLSALVIGIDHYKHSGDSFRDLTGCVADADAMFSYLTETLLVPPDQIINLRDEEATRERILLCVRAFAKDSRVNYGDPIFIYFAGYGSSTYAPKVWEPRGISGHVNMLLPHDFAPWTNDDRGAQGISMLTLTTLLCQLVQAKGDNITVILDASFSGTRTITDKLYPGLFTRAIALPKDYAIIPTIDRDLLTRGPDGRILNVVPERSGLFPFAILLAAAPLEDAHETDGRGWFTRALLWHLSDASFRVDTISATALIGRLPDLPQQRPCCVGLHVSRILFNGMVHGPNRTFSRMIMSADWGIGLDAGTANGVSKNARFDVYASPQETSRSIGSLLVTGVSVCSASMERLTSTGLALYCSPLAWAVQTHAGDAFDVPVAIQLDDSLVDILGHIAKEIAAPGNDRRLQLVDLHHHHELSMAYKDGRVVFQITDSFWRENGRSSLDYSVPATADAVYTVLQHAADFFFLLRNSHRYPLLAPLVRVRVYQVEERAAASETSGEQWRGAAAFERIGGHVNVSGIAVIPIDGHTSGKYGFRITSDHNAPLFVWVFLFDLDDLHIPIDLEHTEQLWEAVPSLMPYGKLEIGYGHGGNGDPLSFELADGLSADVSYLKVFVTEEYVDLSYIARPSPFTESVAPLPKPPTRGLHEAHLIAVVQKVTARERSESAPSDRRLRRTGSRSIRTSSGLHRSGL
ncbi:hypothetical protein K488DRAFT_54834, partial [Vararia minispora EC-137]